MNLEFHSLANADHEISIRIGNFNTFHVKQHAPNGSQTTKPWTAWHNMGGPARAFKTKAAAVEHMQRLIGSYVTRALNEAEFTALTTHALEGTKS